MSSVVQFNRVLKHTPRPYVGPAAAMPFVKWAGGKRSLIPAIAKHFPDEVGTYWEPFVGGGAVFFTFAKRIERVILGDTNEDLAITYQVVKTDVDALVERLSEHERAHRRREGKRYKDGKTYYYRVRDEEPLEPLDVAARFIYLNKTCFNGLYRVNKFGSATSGISWRCSTWAASCAGRRKAEFRIVLYINPKISTASKLTATF